ncbi:hypothetical protein WCT84_02275, partial [Pectobacterium brasiliense]|uniref:hypothetical protein n=1 Tax=Pectobacterium brasiliense TaxID=180957 RepID=UPI0030174C70
RYSSLTLKTVAVSSDCAIPGANALLFYSVTPVFIRQIGFLTPLATARRVAGRKLAIQKRADTDKNPLVLRISATIGGSHAP